MIAFYHSGAGKRADRRKQEVHGVNATKIFVKTMKFVWIKLGFFLLIDVLFIIGGIVWLFICNASQNPSVMMFTGIAILAIDCAAARFIKRYVAYMVKAAHVAVVATAVTTGQIPDNMIAYGTNMVKSRFVATNVFFVLDRLVSGAVRQIQRVIGMVGGLLSFIPVMKTLSNLFQKFVEIAFGFIDECCLGWVFLHPEQGAFKSAADGVAIYGHNIKHLLKDAAKTLVVAVLVTIVAAIIPYFIFYAIAGSITESNAMVIFLSLLIAFLIGTAVKEAFLDSYMMISMMYSYLAVAPQTEFTSELYEKLCKISGKFRKLFGKAQEEEPLVYAEPTEY